MSFSIYFQPCRYDGTMERRISPFTNEPQEFPRNAPLSPGEVEAVRKALRLPGVEACADDVYIVGFEDGAQAELYASSLAEGCMFAVRGAGITPSFAQLLFDILVAGDWVLMGAADNIVIAPNEACAKSAPADLGRVVVVGSASEIQALLEGGFDAWRRYCDKAFGKGG